MLNVHVRLVRKDDFRIKLNIHVTGLDWHVQAARANVPASVVSALTRSEGDVQ